MIAAVTCGLAALCDAEFASTLPVVGSAYTFSYATFGEFVAWVIGWDLILRVRRRCVLCQGGQLLPVRAGRGKR